MKVNKFFLEQQKGFTLGELLITVSIMMILGVVVIITIKPAELLRQSRDARRISDLSELNIAIERYIAQVRPVVLGSDRSNGLGSGACYVSLASNTGLDVNTCGGRFAGVNGTVISASNSRVLSGTGWIPVKLTDIPAGTPFAVLPVDPKSPNTAGANLSLVTDDLYYAYAKQGKRFEINARLESKKYASSSVTDGGDNNSLYEVGIGIGLNL